MNGNKLSQISSLSERNCSKANLQQQLMQRESNLRYDSDPHLFTKDLFRQRYQIAKNLYKRNLVGHYGCVNAIEFSHGGQFLASGGDDKRVLLWDIEKNLAGIGSARVLDFEHASNIFCLCFDSKNRRLLSGGNDDLVICHDLHTGKLNNVFKQDNPIYGISINPENDDVFAMAGESGKILIYDQRNDTNDPFVVAEMRSSFHAVEYHPTNGNLLVTANSKHGAALYDTRKPNEPLIQYVHNKDPLTCMSVRFNRQGNLILGLRRRLPPILYGLQHAEPICTFYHKNYYNSCTMKSCSFAGEDDELVVSGSDDFNLYVWRVSDVDLENIDQWIESTQMVLYGHRSIVNQVRYNREKCLLASSGVEKIIKVWSPFRQTGWTGGLLLEATCSDNPRELFSPFLVNVMTVSSLSHDYSSHNTNEDPRMLAFFDSLIRQEVDGLDSNSSTDSPLETDVNSNSSNFSLASNSFSNSSTTISTTNSSGSDDDNNDNHPPRPTSTSRSRSRSSRYRKTMAVFKRRLKMTRANLDRLLKGNRNLRMTQRRKPTNRITYLIDRHQRALKILPARNVSLRPYQMLKIFKRRDAITRNRRTYAIMKYRLKQQRKSCRKSALSSINNNTEWPTTSSAAVASRSANANKRNNRCKSSKRNGLSVSKTQETSHSNNSPSSDSSSNAVVPSTSTGITTSLRDDILRLRRQQQQIFDSEEDDDDDEDYDNGNLWAAMATSDLCPDHLPFKKKKLNGLQKNSTATAAHTTRRRKQPVRLYRKTPSATSDFRNSISTSPSPSTSANLNERSSHPHSAPSSSSNMGTNRKPNNSKCHLKGSFTKHDAHDSHDSHMDDCGDRRRENSLNLRLSTNNEELHADESGKCGNDSNSCNSMSPSPIKRRKLPSSNHHHISNNNNIQTESEFRNKDQVEMDNAVEEQNNNDSATFTEDYCKTVEQQSTPTKHFSQTGTTSKLKPNQPATSSHIKTTTTTTTTINTTFAYTPDSGVSMNNYSSPAAGGGGGGGVCSANTDSNHVISSNMPVCSSRVVMRLSPCLEQARNDTKQLQQMSFDGDEGISLIKTNNTKKSTSPSPSSSSTTNLTKFPQKIAHVRRNYRKHFVYDNSDDSD